MGNDIKNINEALDNATGKFHLKTFLTAGMGFFTDAYDLFIIGTVIAILPMVGWSLTTTDKALIGSTSLIAAVVGALTFGRLLDYLGRKAVYGLELVLLVIGAIGSALLSFKNPAVLIGWRFLLGIGIGGDYATSSVIMAEYSNIKTRGKYVGSILSMQSIGLVVSSLIALAFLLNATVIPLAYAWKILLIVGAVPPMFVIYYRRKMPEPPRYTVARGDAKKAAENLKNYTGLDVNVSGDHEKVNAPWYTLFKDRKFLITLIGTAGAWFLMDWAFYGNSIMSNDIFKFVITQTGLAGLIRSTEYSALIFTVAALPGYWLATFTLDKIGRKPIQVIGFVMLAVTYGILALFPVLDTLSHVDEFLVIYGISYFFMMFGPNVTTFVYPPEVFPVTTRGLGSGISAAGGKTGAFIGTFVDVFIIASGLSLLMTILAIFAIAATIITVLCLPEPKGRAIEEVSRESQYITTKQ
ncbi:MULTISPECIES: MFS transporter [unclassified Acidiplasma]|uniref:MFS transporter n=1 Tax=unclassified Acidiplasma TaxID=2641301 RepID=UPI0005E4E48E|nr:MULTISPECIES: MFS transporter [unclassified Acidiplasma]KJE48881.1 MFS transporter [Acidiplasma sp. MBA-1]WMT54283.1 MAG: MFS transporter [Acidiplasma sp.]